MLAMLLRLAAAAGTARSAELAAALDISPALAEQMLERLAREGYLRSMTEGCSAPCSGCPDESACLFHHQGQIWALTEKGEKYLAKTQKPS